MDRNTNTDCNIAPVLFGSMQHFTVENLTAEQLKKVVFLLQYVVMGEKNFYELNAEFGIGLDVLTSVFGECFDKLHEYVVDKELDIDDLQAEVTRFKNQSKCIAESVSNSTLFK